MNTERERQQITAGDVGDAGAIIETEKGGALTSLMEELLIDAGAGVELKGSDKAVPFLTILQSNSPQVKEEDAKYVDGAKAGMVFNTVTKQIFDVRMIPGKPVPAGIRAMFAWYNKMMVEWIPDRGGFAGQHLPEDPIVKTAKQIETADGKKVLRLPNGNDLVETAYYYPALYDENPDDLKWAVMGLTSTQLKKSRHLNSFMDELRLDNPRGGQFKPPKFALLFEIRTEVEKKAENTWWGWNIQWMGTAENPEPGLVGGVALAFAKKYFEAVSSSKVTVVPPADDTATKDVPF